jgi:hypothetical protein
MNEIYEIQWNLVKLDREKQQKDLLNSIKNQSLLSSIE